MGTGALRGHVDLLLMEMLDERPDYGYALIDRLRKRSGGAFDLAGGSVYPTLYRMEKNGVVSSDWREKDGRRRRVYALTAKGRKDLTAQRRDYRTFARAMNKVIG